MVTKKKTTKKNTTTTGTNTPAADGPAADGPEQPSRENIKFFMGQMILAGFAGKVVPTATGDKSEAEVQNAAAQKLRQYAERLTNQLRKFD